MKYFIWVLAVGSIVLASCQSANKEHKGIDTDSTAQVPATEETKTDSIGLVRNNYNRIQAITDWDRIDSTDIHESTEGGQVFYYFKNNVLEKMKASYYGESGYSLAEFYLLNKQLSFVFEDVYQYNAHMYSPEFVYEKTKKAWENRFYYMDNKFFKFIGEKDQEADVAGTLDRAKVHQDQFDKYIKIMNNGYKNDIDPK